MEKTTAGLPNTCAGCAKPVTPEEMWYAQDDQAAIAGVAFHSLQCASKHSELSGYSAPKRQVTKSEETAKKPKPAARTRRKKASSSTKTTK